MSFNKQDFDKVFWETSVNNPDFTPKPYPLSKPLGTMDTLNFEAYQTSGKVFMLSLEYKHPLQRGYRCYIRFIDNDFGVWTYNLWISYRDRIYTGESLTIFGAIEAIEGFILLGHRDILV